MTDARNLTGRVHFQKRTGGPDGYGNEVTGPWTTQFSRRVHFVYAGGGEAVVAARLEGKAVMKMRVRQSVEARTITESWRAVDARTGVEWAIRVVDSVADRRWVFLEIERGVAA